MRILKGPAVSGHELEAADVFQPETMSLNLEERKSTATITVGPEAPSITVGMWMQDDTEPGRGIVWRVKSVEDLIEAETRTVQLEHIVNTLRDNVMFGEIGPKEITGSSTATSCTALQALTYIIGQTAHWQLWDSGIHSDYAGVSGPYSFSGDNLFAALETVTGTLEDAYWGYDLSVYPFKICLWKFDVAASCEMRMSRNIQTMRKVVDRSRMYTRFYPIGENDLHIDGDYVSANESAYGTVCRIEADASKKTKAELLAWANERLARHCEPAVTITISGLELVRETGEPLDRLQVNKVCRVPLPEYGTSVTEKITKANWADKIHEPDKVTITLANLREDVASIVNRISRSAASAAKAKAAKDKEDHAWFVDTEDHVGMVAEAIIGRSADGVDWSRVASLIVDGEGIHGRVVRTEGYLVALAAEMDLTEERLRIEFENNLNSTRSEFRMTSESLRIAFENDINCTRSEFLMTSESLRVSFANDLASTRSEFSMTAESLRIAFESDVSSVRSAIEQEAGRISLVVSGTGSNATIKAAEITAEINKTGSTARINANRVVIGDSGTTTTLNDKITIGSGGIMIIDGAVAMHDLSIYAGNGITFNGAAGGQYWELNASSLVGLIKNLKIEQSGNTYTLYKKSFAGSDDADADWAVVGTFNKASTIKGTWSGGVYTVSEAAAASGGVTPPISTTIDKKGESWSGNTCTVSIGYEDPISGNMVATGRSITVDASARYTAGRNDTKVSSTVTWDNAAPYTGDHNTVSFTTDAPSPVSGASKSLVLYLTQDSSFSSHKKNVYMRTGSSAGNKMAQVTVDATSEYTAGRNDTKVSSNVTWDNAAPYTGDHNTVSFTTDAPSPVSGASKSMVLYLTQDSSFSSHTKKVYLRTGSSAGNKMAQVTVDATSEYNQGALDLKNAGGQVTVTANGTTTPNKYVTSLVVNVPAPTPAHSISGFNLHAYSGAGLTIDGTYYTNNSDGYYISSTGRNATVIIIADGAWTCDGVAKTGRDYLQTAAENIYKKGYDNGQANVTISVTEFTAYGNAGESYQNWTNNSDGYWTNSSITSPDAVIVISGRVKVNGKNYTIPNNYIQGAATKLYKAGMTKGWNYYESRSWYLPSDTPPSGYASGKFWMPAPCDSWDEPTTYREWTRGTNAWKSHIGSDYTKIVMKCESAVNQSGNVKYTMTFSGSSYSFSSGSNYDFYY